MSDRAIIVVMLCSVIVTIMAGLNIDPVKVADERLAKATANLERAEAEYKKALEEHYRTIGYPPK
jgi:hypothetical protein